MVMDTGLAPSPPVGPHVLFGFDEYGVCTLSVGPGLKEMGLEDGQLVGVNLLELYAEDTNAIATIQRVLAGETVTVERPFQGRLLSVYYQPLFKEDGAPGGALGVTTDVTAQRATERAAQQARERLAMLADVSTALTREVLHPEAVLRVASTALSEALGGIGAVWIRGRSGLEPAPSSTWGAATETERHRDEWTKPLPPVVASLIRPESLNEGGQTRLWVPMVSRGSTVGLVEAIRRDRGFDPEEIDLASETVDRCALALDNALLFQSERAAREDLIKFKALAEASQNLIAISDPSGRPIYLNSRLEQSGLADRFDDVWSAFHELVGPESVPELRQALTEAGRWSGDLSLEIEGQHRVLQADSFMLAHPDTGKPLGAGWIAQDVTALRSTEAALRSANADLKQFKALVEASPDFIAIAALDGTVQYINPRGRAMIALDPEIDVTGTTIVDYLTPEGIEASLTIEQPAVVAHGHWEGQSTLRHHGGEPPIPVEIASFLMKDVESGEPFALATVQRDITERLAYERALRELADQRQDLLTRLVDAQEVERSQIAADVHDDPVQALSAVELRLGLLARKLRERAPDLIDTLTPLQSSVSGATDRLRALLFDLEPPDLDQGLTWALRRAAEETFADTEVAWTVRESGPVEVEDALRVILYRIAREALTNARKHAGAGRVDVAVSGSDDGVLVTVADDGRGLGAQPTKPTPGHRGLFTMRDRAAIAGGWCTVADRPEGGVLATVWLPSAPSSPE